MVGLFAGGSWIVWYSCLLLLLLEVAGLLPFGYWCCSWFSEFLYLWLLCVCAGTGWCYCCLIRLLGVSARCDLCLGVLLFVSCVVWLVGLFCFGVFVLFKLLYFSLLVWWV